MLEEAEERQAKAVPQRRVLVARGAHTVQVALVEPLVRQAHHLATGQWVEIMLLVAVMVAEAAGEQQAPILEGQEPLAVRLEAQVVVAAHLTQVLVAHLAQAHAAKSGFGRIR